MDRTDNTNSGTSIYHPHVVIGSGAIGQGRDGLRSGGGGISSGTSKSTGFSNPKLATFDPLQPSYPPNVTATHSPTAALLNGVTFPPTTQPYGAPMYTTAEQSHAVHSGQVTMSPVSDGVSSNVSSPPYHGVGSTVSGPSYHGTTYSQLQVPLSNQQQHVATYPTGLQSPAATSTEAKTSPAIGGGSNAFMVMMGGGSSIQEKSRPFDSFFEMVEAMAKEPGRFARVHYIEKLLPDGVELRDDLNMNDSEIEFLLIHFSEKLIQAKALMPNAEISIEALEMFLDPMLRQRLLKQPSSSPRGEVDDEQLAAIVALQAQDDDKKMAAATPVHGKNENSPGNRDKTLIK